MIILQDFLSTTIWYFGFEVAKLSLVFPNCNHVMWRGWWWEGGLSEKKQKKEKALPCIEPSQAIPTYITHSFASDLCLEKLGDMQPYKIAAVKCFNFQSSVVLDNAVPY